MELNPGKHPTVTVQVTKLANENSVSCNAWVNRELVYSVKLPYVKNDTYKLEYTFTDDKKPIRDENLPLIPHLNTRNDLTIWNNKKTLVISKSGIVKSKTKLFCDHEYEYLTMPCNELVLTEVVEGIPFQLPSDHVYAKSTWRCTRCGKIKTAKLDLKIFNRK